MNTCLSVDGVDIDPSFRRSPFKIVWSCATTLFACTYVAIHPNISANETDWVVVWRRIGLMIAMGLVPELVVLWALQQLILASSLRIRHRDQGWTQTHSFFLIMGGYSYYDHEAPAQQRQKTLDYNTLVARHRKGFIEWPTPDVVSAPQIKDRSKADLLTKTIAVVQTLWFCIQFITRLILHLNVTELEIATFAYAVLNSIVYMLWWNKPFDVRSQIHLRGVHDPLPNDPGPDPVPLPHYEAIASFPQPEKTVSTYLGEKWEELKPAINQVGHGPLGLMLLPYDLFQRLFAGPFGQKYTDYSGTAPEVTIPRHPNIQGRFLTKIGRRLEHFLLSLFKTESDVPATATRPKARKTNYPFAISIAIIFGGIHLIAWPFTFPSVVEMWLWRASSLALVAPAVFLTIMRIPGGQVLCTALPEPVKDLFAILGLLCMLLASWVYAAARITILFLPLLELRRLPCRAFEDINWLGIFFPHI